MSDGLIRRRIRAAGALSMVLSLVVGIVGLLAPTTAAADTSGFVLPPGVTFTPGGSNCNGIMPPGNQTFTGKTLTGGTLLPGGQADYTITFPTGNNVGDFQILDCVVLVPAGALPQNFTSVIAEGTFSLVNNSTAFKLGIGVIIPQGVKDGDQICNIAKTTQSPSGSPASNRKAGPACFVVGGSARVEKRDAVSHALVDGATFTVSNCVNATTVDPKSLQPIVVTAEDASGKALPTPNITTDANGVPSGTVVAAVLGFNGASGSTCNVTETTPPPGYLLPTTGLTKTVLIGATTQTTAVFNDTPATPDLALTKTADASSVAAGTPIGFTMTVANTGTAAATGVTITDPLPTGTGVTWAVSPAVAGCSITGGTLTCDVGTLGIGKSFSVHVTSATTAASCQKYDNTATLHSTNGGPDQNKSASTTVSCSPLVISKVADATPVSAGDTIGYTITVTNSGDIAATNVHLADTYPVGSGLSWSIADAGGADCSKSTAAALDCTLASLGAKGVWTVKISSPTTFASCGKVDNTATVTADTTTDKPTSTIAEIVVQCPDVQVTKSADAGSVSAGTPIGFTVTVQNKGAGTAKGVAISDPLPSGTDITWTIDPANRACSITGGTLKCTAGDLAPNATFSVHVTSTTTQKSCQAYDNTATVSATNHADVNGSATTTVTCPSITVTKTATAASVGAGNTIGFDITVANGGPGTATGVTLTDTLPTTAGTSWTVNPAVNGCSISGGVLTCDLGTLAKDQSVTVHLSSPTTTASCGAIDNTATATPTNGAAATSAKATVTVTCPTGGGGTPAVQANDLSITKTGSPGQITLGGNATFTITATNNGPLTATGVIVTDVLPANTTFVSATPAAGSCTTATGVLSCAVGTMGVGSSVSITVVVTPQQVGTVVNTATVKGNEPETNLANNTATASVQVAGLPVIAPTTTTSTTAAPTTTTIVKPVVAPATLPRTGGDPHPLLQLAGGLFALGGLLLVGSDRRIWKRLRRS